MTVAICAYLFGMLVYFLLARRVFPHAVRVSTERQLDQALEAYRNTLVELGIAQDYDEEEARQVMQDTMSQTVSRWRVVGALIRSVMWPFAVVEDLLGKGI